jgi:hypothetical protein
MLLEELVNLPAPMGRDEIDRFLAEQDAHALGPNLAILGFWDKAAGSILAGLVIYREERPSSFRRDQVDQIVYVQGAVRYGHDVELEEEGEVIKAGTTIAGVFAYQLDTASQMIWNRPLGSRLRATMADGLVDIGQGRQRYDYAEIRCLPPQKAQRPAARPPAQKPAPGQPNTAGPAGN